MVGRGPFFFGLDRPSVADLAVYGQLFFLYDKAIPEGRTTVENYPALTELCLRLDVMTD
jgi:glutathione S-transferase